MTALAVRAEIVKLSRLFGTPELRLEFLQRMPLMTLRKFREAAQDQVFMAGHTLFHRLAMAGRLLPAALNALLAEKVFGAVLAAGISNEFDPPRAVHASEKMSIGFLTDVSIALDPRRAREIVRQMPVPRVVAVAQELARRGEYITMARFVDAVTEPALKAVIADTKNEEVLLRTSFFVESPARVSQIMLGLPEARLKKLLQLADTEVLRADTMDLFGQLPAQGQDRLFKLARALGLARLQPK